MKFTALALMASVVSADPPKISIINRNYPHENSWEILNSEGTVVCKGGDYTERDKVYDGPECSLPDEKYSVK